MPPLRLASHVRAAQHATVRILGIDPGLATVGVGLIEATNPHAMTVIDWCAITTAAGGSLPDRLAEIHRDLDAFLKEAKPDIAVVEKLYFSRNEQTAFDVAQARGAILVTIAGHGISVIEPTPMQVKLCVTGSGSADKKQMQAMVTQSLKLKEIPRPDDAADALGLAIYGAVTAAVPRREAGVRAA
jgi:crossover junction endodeoxyribonuclease RuvC